MITADAVSFAYGDVTVLEGIDLSAGSGRVVGLIGPNGSGKTTMLRTLYAGLEPKAGLVNVDGDPVGSLKPRDLARRLAVVMQEGSGELPLTAGEVVLLGRAPHRSTFERHTTEDFEVAAQALSRVGARHLAERVFTRLSGGERQRVLIARALAQEADHLLLDEPTNHLDIRYQHEVLQLIRGIGVTTVVVLHDLNLAARYCDELILLDGGRVAASGSPDVVLRPDVLEPVYQIGVERVPTDDGFQLLFHLPATDDVQSAINRYWNGRAGSYNDHHVRQVSTPEIRDAWVEVWRRALPPPPARVLDVGTGTGHAALLLAELGYDVVGVDLAGEMLTQARAKAAGLEHPPAFEHGDAVDPPFEPASFDAITARYVLWTLRTPKTALTNWAALLRPGGTVAVVDSTWFPGGVTAGACRDSVRDHPEFTELYHRGVLDALPLAESVTIDDTAEQLRGAGFREVAVEPLTGILELDRRYGVAEGHEVQLQYVITGRMSD